MKQSYLNMYPASQVSNVEKVGLIKMPLVYMHMCTAYLVAE